MLAGLLFVAFFAIALAGVPLLYALLTTTVGAVVIAGLGHPLESIFLSFIGGVEPYILIAVPLFIFAGEILASGGVGRRIVDFARALLGFLPGGLGVATVASCLMFGGVSGSAIADTAAIGSLVIPAMIQRGYSRGFAAALLGGIDNPWGAVLGGFIVGVLENLLGAYVIGTELKLTVALVLIVGVLTLKPSGLFGKVVVTV